MKVKMTNSIKARGLLAGLVYELSEKEARKLISHEKAVAVDKEKVKNGNG